MFRDKASEVCFVLFWILEVMQALTVSYKLRDAWILLSKDHSKPIDVLAWLSRATLDVIGIAGM